MTDHDQLFKGLLKRFFGDLLELTVPKAAARLDASQARFLEQESFSDVPAGERVLLDLVAEAPTLEGEMEWILFLVEVEGDYRRRSANRFWRYYAHLRLKHDRPVLLVVMWLRGGPPGVSRQQVVDRVFGEEVHRFTYVGFGLSGSVAEEYLALPQPLAWGLAALMRPRSRDRVEQKLACLRAIARGELGELERYMLLDTVETYLQLRGEEAARYTQLLTSGTEDEEVKTMALTWAGKIEAKAFDRGVQQGLERGVERGREQGQRQMLRIQLERRFGALPEEAVERLAAIHDPRALDDLGERLFDANSLEELGLVS